ncbi:MAG: nucleotidyltransferase domain-containing protein [Nanoarchaeota archaeon]
MINESFEKIKNFLLKRYKNNLAGILIFGSANTGHFKHGESDIDTMIFLKEKRNLDFKKEINYLLESLKSKRFATQYFFSLDSLKDYIKDRVSFSTYITIISKDGSKILYSTPEFEDTKIYLLKNPPSKESIKKYIKEKDQFELKGYFKNIKGFSLTKALFAHLRRKLQILNYFKTKNLVFDYEGCMNNLDLTQEIKKKLNLLYRYYNDRKELSEKEINMYYSLASELANIINNN